MRLKTIECILLAHGEGKHIVWMPIETAREIRNLPGLSDYGKRVIVELESLVTEIRNIEKKFSFHLEVDFLDPHKFDFQEEKLTIGFKKIQDTSFLQHSIFLAENGDDIDLIRIASEIFISRTRSISSICKVEFDERPGGGSTIFDIFKRLNGIPKKPFLCLVDSDKSHPSASYGSTAIRFQNAGITAGKKANYQLLITNSHELENIIPVEILSKLFEQVNDYPIFTDERLSQFRGYADHKEGLKATEARDLDTEYNHEYWRPLYDDIDDDEIICPSLGGRVLSRCIESLKKTNTHILKNEIDPEKNDYWECLSKLGASWGVGLKTKVR